MKSRPAFCGAENVNGGGMDKYKSRMIFNGVMTALAAALIVTVAVLSRNTELSERATRTVTFAFTNSLGRLSSSLPFSLFELLAFIAAVVAIFLIIKGIVNLAKRRTAKGLCSFTTLVATVLCVVSIYMLDTSFAYNRETPPLDIYENGELSDEEISAASDAFFDDFIALANSIERDEYGFPVCDLSVEEISDLIRKEYEKLDDGYFCDYIPRAKGMFFSSLMSEASLGGITFTPIGEANVNDEMPITDKIFTVAHEMAHSIGIMREEDANLVATYVLLNSENDLLRYSATYSYYTRVLDIVEVLDKDKYEAYRDALYAEDSVIRKEEKAVVEFWKSKKMRLAKISDFFNNLYLKFNGQNLGTGSYNDDNFWEVTPSEPDDDGNVTYEITLSDIQLVLISKYAG